MLLRSASAPILKSFSPLTVKDASPEPDFRSPLHRTRPITLSASSSATLSPVHHNNSFNRMTRALSDSNLRDLGLPEEKKQRQSTWVLAGLAVTEEDRDLGNRSPAFEEVGGLKIGSFRGMYLGSGLDGPFDGWTGSGGSDGGGGGDGGFGGEWEEDRRSESLDAYYRRMIEADPGNPLLLSNYAKYLKELRGDLVRAEEYCGRAILANPNDGGALSMFGELMWVQHNDAERAEAYFSQAIKASPDDCYVMASYARFLWDAEDEEDVEEVAELSMAASSPSIFHGILPPVPPPPIAAAP